MFATDLDELIGENGEEQQLVKQWMKQHRQHGFSMTGVMVICVVLAVIAVVFFGCCLLLRFMHRALGSHETKNRSTSPCKNVVIHSKRVYEIQAEEGCLTSLPNMPEIVSEPSKILFDEQRGSTGDGEFSGSSLKRPETGDLKVIRHEHECGDLKHATRKREQKIHKDSVCAFLFKPESRARHDTAHCL